MLLTPEWVFTLAKIHHIFSTELIDCSKLFVLINILFLLKMILDSGNSNQKKLNISIVMNKINKPCFGQQNRILHGLNMGRQSQAAR